MYLCILFCLFAITLLCVTPISFVIKLDVKTDSVLRVSLCGRSVTLTLFWCFDEPDGSRQLWLMEVDVGEEQEDEEEDRDGRGSCLGRRRRK